MKKFIASIISIALSFMFSCGTEMLNVQAQTSQIVISNTDNQTVKGWGLTASTNYSIWGRYFIDKKLAQQTLMDDFGISINRINMMNANGNDDGSVNNTIMNETCDLIRLTLDKKLDYFISIFSPPTGMKTQNIVGSKDSNGNAVSLRVEKEADFCKYVVNFLTYIQNQNLEMPKALSMQNEPSCMAEYDACYYTVAQYQRVVKSLRQAMDNAGFANVMLIGPEDGSYNIARTWNSNVMYLGGNGFPALENDVALNNAIGGFAGHSYAKNPTLGDIAKYVSSTDKFQKDRWMTEYCVGDMPTTIVKTQDNMAMYATRRLIADMGFVKNNYWFWWTGWLEGRQILDGQVLLEGDGKTTISKSKLYFILQKIFKNAPVGSTVRTVSTNDSELISSGETQMDMLAFAYDSKMTVVLTNPTNNDKTINATGFLGSVANIYQTTATKNMELSQTKTITNHQISDIILPANSITVIVTDELSKPVLAKGKATSNSVELSWSAPEIGTPTGYIIKRDNQQLANISNTTNYIDNTVSSNTNYTYQIVAYNDISTSDPFALPVKTGNSSVNSIDIIKILPNSDMIFAYKATAPLTTYVSGAVSEVSYYIDSVKIAQSTNATNNFLYNFNVLSENTFNMVAVATDVNGNSISKSFVFKSSSKGVVRPIYQEYLIYNWASGINFQNVEKSTYTKIEGDYSFKVKNLANKDFVNFRLISSGFWSPIRNKDELSIKFWIYMPEVMKNFKVSLINKNANGDIVECRLPISSYVLHYNTWTEVTIPFSAFYENGTYFKGTNGVDTATANEFDWLNNLQGIGFSGSTINSLDTYYYLDDISYITFEEAPASVEVVNFVDGLENSISANAEILNKTRSQYITLILASYRDNKIVDLETITRIVPVGRNILLSSQIKADGNDVVKCFFLDGFNNLKPIDMVFMRE